MYGKCSMSRLTENDIALAGEYMLGLLNPAEQAVAQARAATDVPFAAEIDAWRLRLQTMLDGPDVAAPDHSWAKLLDALPAPTGQDVGVGRLRLWQGLTALSAAAVGFLSFSLWQQTTPVPPRALPPVATQNAPPLIAALSSDTGTAAITARYDAQNGELLLMPVSLDTGKLYPELWVIPADGKARSLGMMAVKQPTQVIVTAEMRQFIAQGATLAITPEPQAGAPGGKATGPVIASGKIVAI
jgi:anti-sigma-K factor RskA